jgi:hypothetical protein
MMLAGDKIRLGKSVQVWFSQVGALRQSVAVALGRLETAVVVTRYSKSLALKTGASQGNRAVSLPGAVFLPR